MAQNQIPVTNEKGEFIRNGRHTWFMTMLFTLNCCPSISETTFRKWVKDDSSAEFPAEENRYHLYVALACPWVTINQMLILH